MELKESECAGCGKVWEPSKETPTCECWKFELFEKILLLSGLVIILVASIIKMFN